jgi:hypothetical protein
VTGYDGIDGDTVCNEFGEVVERLRTIIEESE